MDLIDAALLAASALHEKQAKRGSSVVPTPRRFLLEGLGCDHRAEPIAYFEYENLYDLLKQARTAIEGATGSGLEQIRLQPDTWFEELEGLFRPLSKIPSPESATLRPGCEPKVRPGTCRLPTLGVVAVVHYALDQRPYATLAGAIEELQIAPNTTSFDILKSVDPTVQKASVPEGLGDLRDKLVPAIPTGGDDSRISTARLLHRLSERYDGVAVRDLMAA